MILNSLFDNCGYMEIKICLTTSEVVTNTVVLDKMVDTSSLHLFTNVFSIGRSFNTFINILLDMLTTKISDNIDKEIMKQPKFEPIKTQLEKQWVEYKELQNVEEKKTYIKNNIMKSLIEVIKSTIKTNNFINFNTNDIYSTVSRETSASSVTKLIGKETLNGIILPFIDEIKPILTAIFEQTIKEMFEKEIETATNNMYVELSKIEKTADGKGFIHDLIKYMIHNIVNTGKNQIKIALKPQINELKNRIASLASNFSKKK